MKKISKATALKKTFSLLLSFVMILVIIPVTAAHADDSQPVTVGHFTEDELYSVIKDAENVPAPLLESLSLRESDVPSYMEKTNLRETNAVMRLKDKEDDLSVVKYLNADGTVSEYIMAENVKYEINGRPEDKTNRLEYSALLSEYTNPDNDIRVKLPSRISAKKGVTVTAGKYSVEIIPAAVNERELIKESDGEGDYVIYKDLFGEGIDAEYHVRFSGFKENIVINEETETNEFTFTVLTNGLVLENGGTLYDGETAVFDIGELVIYDASGRRGKGHALISEIEYGQAYEYTVTVDREFLSDPGTVYPVTVDPTVTWMDCSIKDVELKSNSTSVNPNNQYLYIGDILYGGESCILIKSSTLNYFASHNNASNVALAELYLYAPNSLSGNMYVGVYKIGESWSETSTTVSSTLYNSIDTTVRGSGYLNHAGFNMINITLLVKDYCNDNSIGNGFALKQIGSYSQCSICSSENTYTDYRPYIRCIKIQSGASSNIVDKSLYKVNNNYDSSKYLAKQKSGSAYNLAYSSTAMGTGSTENFSNLLAFNRVYDGVYTLSFISSKEENKQHYITFNSTNINVTLNKLSPSALTTYSYWYVINNTATVGKYLFVSYFNPAYFISLGNIQTNNLSRALWNATRVGLDVPIYQQQGPNSCGPACARMILKYFGITSQENGSYMNSGQLRSYLNNSLNVDFLYCCATKPNSGGISHGTDTEAGYLPDFYYLDYLTYQIGQGRPCVCLIDTDNANNASSLPYPTESHFIVIKGRFTQTVNGELQQFFVTSDSYQTYYGNGNANPNGSYYGEYVISADDLLKYVYTWSVVPYKQGETGGLV